MSDQYYRFFPGDYARATPDLSLVEHGAYRLLLDAYYSTGPLTADTEKLARICRATTPEERKAVETVTRRFFTIDGDVIRNRKADHEITGRQHFIEEQTRKSKLGVAARLKALMDNPGVDPGDNPKVNPPSPSPSPDLSPKESKQQHHPQAADARVFPSSDQGNGNGNPSGKGRPYIDPVELIGEQREVLDAWEDVFGRISMTERYEAAKLITAMRRKERYTEEEFIEVVDWYAAKQPKHPMPPTDFFGGYFEQAAAAAGVEPYGD